MTMIWAMYRTVVTLNVLTNDDLSDGSNATPLTVTVDLNPATPGIQDTLTVAGQGEWVYNPATGEVTFTPEVAFTTDPTDINYILTETITGLSDTAAINVEYTEIPPVAVNDNDLGNVPGTAVTLNVLTNDDLSDGSNATPLTVTVDLNPATPGIQDTLTVAGQGEWVYNPATGEVTFTPEVAFTTDPTDINYILTETLTGLSDTAAINVEYTEIPPVAVNDNDLGNVPGTVVTLNVLTNDDLSDGSNATPLTVTVDLNPATPGIQDTLTVAGQGEWVYNPATGEVTFTPEVAFTTDPTDINYILTETLTGLSDTAAINVEYTEIPPVAVNDNDLGNVPGTAVTLNVLTNDDLSDGSNATPLTVTVDLNPATPGIQDTLTVAGQGEWVYNPATGEVTFTPEVAFTTDPTDINYILTETITGLSDTAAINVEYTEIPPVAVNDNDLGNVPGTAVTLNVLTNDDLSDGSNATPLTVTVDLNPATPGIQDTLTVAGQGEWVYNPATGEVTFTPEVAFTTDPTDINYILTETLTGLSDTAAINVEYTEIPPVAVNDNDLGNVPGTAVTLNVLTNDDLSDGSNATPLTVTVDLNPATPGIQDTLTVAGQGEWVYNPATGEVTFTPEVAFTTDPTDINYILTETITGLSDTAAINVEYTEIPPVAVNDNDLGNVPGTAVTLNVLTNDDLSDGSNATPLTVTVDLNPATPGIQDTLTVAGQGEWVYNPATGEVTFTPEVAFTTDPTDINYILTETITGLSDTAAINVEYTEIPPVAVNDNDLGNVPGTAVTLNVLTNDDLSDGSNATPLTVTVDLNPATPGIQDTLTVAGQGEWVYNPATGEVIFTPEVAFTTDPTDINYILTETLTGLSDTAAINVEYTEIPPVAVNDNDLGNVPGTAVTLNVLTNDDLSDGSNATPLTVTVDLNPATPGIQDTLTVAGQGEWVYNPATGEVTFTPEVAFTTDPTDINYILTETLTGLSDTAAINVEYTEIPPVAVNDNDLGNVPGTAVTLNVLTNDDLSDGSNATPLTVTVDLNPATPGIQDTLTVAGQGEWVYNPATGEVTFTPEVAFTTDPTDINYILTETLTGLSDTAAINVEYTEIPPVAVNDNALGNVPGTAVTLNVLTNDDLSDGSNATPLTVTVDLNPATPGIQDTLTVAGQGEWVYNPATGEVTFTPEVAFTTDPTDINYILTETITGLSDTAAINVEYTEIPPVAVNDNDLGNVPGTAVTLNVLTNDDLSDGSNATPATVTVDLNPATPGIQDTLTVAGQGEWVYNPATGEVTFTPEVAFTTDPTDINYILTETLTGLSDTAAINVEYTEIPPVAVNDNDLGNVPGTAVTLNVLTNDDLSDGSNATPLTVTVDLNPATPGIQDTLTVAGQGEWVYNPATGEVTFTPEVAFTTDPTDINYILTETLTGLSDTAAINVEYRDPTSSGE
ncbi:MAG: hypothetical protein IPP05_09805 [Cytophagaceae bacterium]|nr:hypothetical protein [Cytophagaceae bacterium]